MQHHRLPTFAAGLLFTAFSVEPPSHAAVGATVVVTGVSAPTAFVDPPGGLFHRLIAQQGGDILVWDNTTGTTPLATRFLDLRNDAGGPGIDKVQATGSEEGLLSLIAHPNYASNGFVYVYYTSTNWDGAGGINAGDIVVERYTRSLGDPKQADPLSGQVVLVVPHPGQANHNGGDLEFGPDGYLYISFGDGGGSCDTTASSQDLTRLRGKMVRIDVDGDDFPVDPQRNYRIPPDNPLVGVAGEDEIWAFGLRNPFRFSFDRDNGDIYIGDVGQNDWEEINHLPHRTVTAGNPVNFGWPCWEGLDPSGCGLQPASCQDTEDVTFPVIQEPNTPWQAIMGGYMYRGSEVVADLGGRYIYGDALDADIYLATPVASPTQWPRTLAFSNINPYGFAEDGPGELYMLSTNSTDAIRCLHPGGGSCPWATEDTWVFDDGFETGDALPWSAP